MEVFILKSKKIHLHKKKFDKKKNIYKKFLMKKKKNYTKNLSYKNFLKIP